MLVSRAQVCVSPLALQAAASQRRKQRAAEGKKKLLEEETWLFQEEAGESVTAGTCNKSNLGSAIPDPLLGPRNTEADNRARKTKPKWQ